MTEKITREEIEALLKLADAATPGPWVKHDTMPNGSAKIWASFPCINGLSAYFTIARIDTPGDDEVGYTEGAINSHQTIANAEFIAAANPSVLKALCTLALQALDMEPRPIEEAPNDGKFIGFLEDGRACTMSWRQHVKTWKPIEGGGHVPDGYHWLTCEEDHDSHSPRKAIAWIPFPPLSSLPEPRR